MIGDPGPDGMFDDRLYKRGALTLHALRLTAGDDVFFDVLRTWTARYRHGTVSTELFVACAEKAQLRLHCHGQQPRITEILEVTCTGTTQWREMRL
jgi:aminopeptidase N